jgi:DNA-binding transcriptional LysR family regulator
MAMNLHHLRAFVAVATEANITRAAKGLRTSQPAVSKQLVELEGQLGTPLFARLARGVRLTEAGEILLRHAQRILAAERSAELEIGELSGLVRGRLSIGASTTIGSYLAPSALGAFNRAHPKIRLELEIANTALIQAMVLDDRIDLGLIEGFVSSDQLDVEVIHYDEMVAIAAPSHPLAKKGKVSARDFVKLPLISRERGSGTREVIEAAFSKHGLLFEPAMTLGSTEAVKNAVAVGLGVAVVSGLALDLELAAGRLSRVNLHDLDIRRALHLVRLKGKGESHAVAAFHRVLREVLGTPLHAKTRPPRSR